MTDIQSFRYILASGSPRRKELLGGLDVRFRTDTSCPVEEKVPSDLEPEKIPEFLACLKSSGYTHPLDNDEILITSDTLVLCPGTNGRHIPLGKPSDRAAAIRMLEMLSGKTHKVLSGVCLRASTKSVSFTSVSEVTFKELTQEEIEYYVDNYKPYDKAGAYAIQEWIGYIGITGIKGSYFNIVGLPVQRLYSELQEFVKGL